MTQTERRDFTSFAILESGDTAYDFRIPLFASAPLYESMLDFTQLLVGLRELTFTNAVLLDTIHTLLHLVEGRQIQGLAAAAAERYPGLAGCATGVALGTRDPLEAVD